MSNMAVPDPVQLADQGRSAFEAKKFDEAAGFFQKAVDGFTRGRNDLMAAEMKNNMSVALLQAGKPQQALDAVTDTDTLFENANDIKRQAMALANQAAALEALDRPDEAIQKYETSAELFHRIHEGDMQALVKKSVAAIELKRGRVTSSAFKMMRMLEAREKPSLFERLLRYFLRLFMR
jgi:tetratricopeptide (TPR) repeat protein